MTYSSIAYHAASYPPTNRDICCFFLFYDLHNAVDHLPLDRLSLNMYVHYSLNVKTNINCISYNTPFHPEEYSSLDALVYV